MSYDSVSPTTFFLIYRIITFKIMLEILSLNTSIIFKIINVPECICHPIIKKFLNNIITLEYNIHT